MNMNESARRSFDRSMRGPVRPAATLIVLVGVGLGAVVAAGPFAPLSGKGAAGKRTGLFRGDGRKSRGEVRSRREDVPFAAKAEEWERRDPDGGMPADLPANDPDTDRRLLTAVLATLAKDRDLDDDQFTPPAAIGMCVRTDEEVPRNLGE